MYLYQVFGTGSSPRTWGCFQGGCYGRRQGMVFPTHVGVFLPALPHPHRRSGLPHARGGVSITPLDVEKLKKSSPRTWGCFAPDFCRERITSSSPRTWGCFQIPGRRSKRHIVFPTHVGVFPGKGKEGRSGSSLPHARGGVSDSRSLNRDGRQSSPRTWGCF